MKFSYWLCSKYKTCKIKNCAYRIHYAESKWAPFGPHCSSIGSMIAYIKVPKIVYFMVKSQNDKFSVSFIK
jgi:hypothetical protein